MAGFDDPGLFVSEIHDDRGEAAHKPNELRRDRNRFKSFLLEYNQGGFREMYR